MKSIHDYADCEVFKPGEIWRSPRGNLYEVENVRVRIQASLRHVSSRRLHRRAWDGVIGWARVAAAPFPALGVSGTSDQSPSPSFGNSEVQP